MSRSGYSDDGDDNWATIRWRGAVASAIRGARGQALLVELLEALDAMPEKRLVANEFQADGAHCALGVVGAKRGIDLSQFDTGDDWYDECIGRAFNIADALAREIMWVNDDNYFPHGADSDAARWRRVRAWVVGQILPETSGLTGMRDLFEEDFTQRARDLIDEDAGRVIDAAERALFACWGCNMAAGNPKTGAYVDGCVECQARSLASSQEYHRSSALGYLTQAYQDAIWKVFGTDTTIADAHARVKAAADRIGS